MTKDLHNFITNMQTNRININEGLKARTANSTYKKLAVQWLNPALCLVDSEVLRNRQLLVAAKR
jgi:hypothetical protein